MESTATLIKQIVTLLNDDQETAVKVYRKLENIATRASAPGKDSERAEVAAALAATIPTQLEAMNKAGQATREMYVPQALAKACNQTLRLLSYVAGAAEVPALVEALGNLDTREMARFALDRRACPETSKALIDALEQVGPVFRVGVVGALARRTGCSDSLAALKKATDDSDRDVANAALDALANFPDPSCDELMARAAGCGCPKGRERVTKVRLRLAETLCKADKKAAARKICKAIQQGETTEAQKKAAGIILKVAG